SAVAQVKKADFLLHDGQNQAAFETANTKLRFEKIGYLRHISLGEVYYRLEEFAKAFDAFQTALASDDALADSLVAKIQFRSAQAAYRQGNAGRALQALRESRAKTTDDLSLAALQELEGDIYLDLRGDAPFAIRVFSRYITTWPHQPQIDDVQARLARSYEKKQNWLMAADEWRRLLKLYPASPYAAVATNNVELIEKYMQPDLSSILATALDENFDNEHPKISKVKRLMLLQAWDKALYRLQSIQDNVEDAQIRTQSALLMGQCYFAKASRAQLLDDGNEFALFDSAKTVLGSPDIVWQSEQDVSDRDLILGTIQLKNMLDDVPASLDAISLRHPLDPRFTQIHRVVLEDKVDKINVADDAALGELRQRLDNFSSSNDKNNGAGIYFKAQLALALKDTAATLAILEQINDQMHSLQAAQAVMLQAQLLLRTNRNEAAKGLLLTIRERYFYHEIAEKATLLLAREAYEQGDYDGVRKWLHYIKSIHERSVFFHSSQLDADVRFLMAQTALAAGNKLEASHAYLNFLQHYQHDDRAPSALFQLANLAAEQKIVHLAREYYQNFLAQYKTHPLAPRTRLALTKLELEEHRYVRARELALQCLAETSGTPLEAEAMHDAILAQLRQGNIKNSSNDIKSFRKKFPESKEFYGTLLYELGQAWIRAKNFGKAEDVFKDLRKDLKNTDFAVRGELGLARSYLLRNKTDDGLEILQELPQKYRGHAFLRFVYLELGDFYQTEKMYQPAITAYNKVLADTLIDDTYKNVLVKLIDLYANIGLSDAAISYARHYIKTYPNDSREFAYRLKIATLHRDKRDFEQAIAVYRELLPLAHGEDKAEILFFLGDSYYNLRRYEQAAAEFMKMKYYAPKTKQNWRTTALFKAGDCYLQLENLPKARDLFDLVLRLEGEASVFGRSAKKRLQEIDAVLQKKQSTGFFQSAQTGRAVV
ncbi:MAG: hypothetical protein DWQ10_03975, partial [Calditrichaeota bacterium]